MIDTPPKMDRSKTDTADESQYDNESQYDLALSAGAVGIYDYLRHQLDYLFRLPRQTVVAGLSREEVRTVQALLGMLQATAGRRRDEMNVPGS